MNAKNNIFQYLKPYSALFALGLLFLLLSSLLSLSFPLLLGKLFGAGAALEGSLDDVQNTFILLIGVFGLQAMFSFMRIWLFSMVSENALANLRQVAYKKMLSFPLDFFHRNKVAELSSRMASDVSLLEETFNSTIAEFFRQIIIIIGSLCFLFFMSIKMTLVMLGTLPVMILIAVFFGRFVRKISKETQNQTALANTLLEEALRSILVVKSFVSESFEWAKYKKTTDFAKQLAIKNALWRGAFVSFVLFCMLGSVVFIIQYGLHLKLSGEISEENFFSFLFSSIFIGASIGSLPEFYAKIQKSIGASDRLMDILSQPTENMLWDTPIQAIDCHKDLILQNISFTYPARADVLVLDNISLCVERGKTTALVGASGAGKSSLLQLITRFYAPNSGGIYLGEESIAHFSLWDWRSQIALVPQEIALFGGSIRENIAYGKPNASEAEIIAAAGQANAWEFISQFPEGLDTFVGDRGVQLSGGQKQRIVIARAVLKNPSILLLDEATSALDNESERLVQGALDTLMQNRTSVVIAHRLSTIQKADKIVVLEKGKIIEQGTHEDLIQKQGAYYQLYHA
jgi:ABC-type multidrug transport system fused ATPase/permease subunit